MKTFIANWQTTILGLGSVLTAIGTALTQAGNGGLESVSWGVVISAVLGGIGVMLARQQDVSTEESR